MCQQMYSFLKRDESTTNRRNPPELRVTSGQKPSTKIIYIVYIHTYTFIQKF